MDNFGYSKWDHLELSDDRHVSSQFQPDSQAHPNVDKKSFIRWKQRDIHEKRAERKRRREHLHKESDMNEQLLAYINRLINQLKNMREARPEEVVADVIHGLPKEPVEANVPSYAHLMDSLFGQVKEAVKTKNEDGDKTELYIKEIKSHVERLETRQTEISAELGTMAVEDSKKITSDDLTVMVNKGNTKPALSKPTEKKSVKTVEVLNPEVPAKNGQLKNTSSGTQVDSEDELEEQEETSIEPSEAAKQFGMLKLGDFAEAKRFLASHPELFEDEVESDGLLIEAFRAEMKGHCEYARQCVDRAQLLSFCRKLGPDGVNLFFQKITTPGHQALKVFVNDVNSTYARIKERAAVIAAEPDEGPAGVEQIQLQAVDPNTHISILVPRENSDVPAERESRTIFECFPPSLQRALQTGELGEVNKVLGKMNVDEAEEIVEKLSRGGMLSIEEGILDATQEGFELPDHLRPKQQQVSKNRDKPEKQEVIAVDDVD
ncbi:Hsp90 co-chaperone Cdc37 [Neolecta irregularis DAH-3]|uniref:Hsp90 chaperone protein kinase-targeting subunit n=1 Tax=Neolecta irregularis (strain DAH-3) TaxID=1198029 RepID=A0A1U7LS18_NEOID|nr:Hsp90 co-chaperone Cdc37 [Neolecta irregularis DAH-3]|eukprot:OLL25418.1 Hsp90 co-chaperone Cdc37 [Neolecta irregularis DAH-3]